MTWNPLEFHTVSRHRPFMADHITLSSFGCLASGEPHLFKISPQIEGTLVKDSDILARNVLRSLEDGQELLTLLDSPTLQARPWHGRNSAKVRHCHGKRPNQVAADCRSPNQNLRDSSPNRGT
jgi:hypothetical protein